MDNKSYSTFFLNRLADRLRKDYHWKTQTLDDGRLVAYAYVPTVIGSCRVEICFDGERVWAALPLAEGFDLEELSREELLDVVYRMSNVTRMYANLILPVFVDSRKGSGVDLFLRSIVWTTSQNDPGFNQTLGSATGVIIDFLAALNNDLGTTILKDFIRIFID